VSAGLPDWFWGDEAPSPPAPPPPRWLKFLLDNPDPVWMNLQPSREAWLSFWTGARAGPLFFTRTRVIKKKGQTQTTERLYVLCAGYERTEEGEVSRVQVGFFGLSSRAKDDLRDLHGHRPLGQHDVKVIRGASSFGRYQWMPYKGLPLVQQVPEVKELLDELANRVQRGEQF